MATSKIAGDIVAANAVAWVQIALSLFLVFFFVSLVMATAWYQWQRGHATTVLWGSVPDTHVASFELPPPPTFKVSARVLNRLVGGG